MQWNETVRDGMPLYYETRERERERETFPWRFVGGGGDGDGGGLAFMVAFLSFLFGSERCDTIGRVCARSRE